MDADELKVKCFSENCHDGWGEDLIICDERTKRFAVLDGATCIDQLPTEGFHSQAEWMVHDFEKRFYTERGFETLDFPGICAYYAMEREPEFIKKFPVYNKPCFVAASAFAEFDEMHFSCIGDCSVFIRFKDGTVCEYSDASTERFSEKTRLAKALAMEEGRDPEEASRLQRIENKSMLNREGGYSAVSFGSLPIKTEEHVFPSDIIDSFILCSDGFRRVLDVPGIRIDDLFSGSLSPEEAAAMLRNFERSQTDSWQVKKHDDMSCILVR